MVLALSTGMRYGEIMNLRWSDVDFTKGRIILQDTKNGERRNVPLTGRAHQQIEKLSKIRRIEIFRRLVLSFACPICAQCAVPPLRKRRFRQRDR